MPARAKSRSGCSQQNQRSDARREANAIATGSICGETSMVTLASRRGPPLTRPASSSSAVAAAKELAASKGAESLALGLGARAADRDLARSRHLDQAVRADHALERVDLC